MHLHEFGLLCIQKIGTVVCYEDLLLCLNLKFKDSSFMFFCDVLGNSHNGFLVSGSYLVAVVLHWASFQLSFSPSFSEITASRKQLNSFSSVFPYAVSIFWTTEWVSSLLCVNSVMVWLSLNDKIPSNVFPVCLQKYSAPAAFQHAAVYPATDIPPVSGFKNVGKS